MYSQPFQLAIALLLLAPPTQVWSRSGNDHSTPNSNDVENLPELSTSAENVQLDELKQMLLTVIEVQSTILRKVESLEKSVDAMQDLASYKLHDLEDRAIKVVQGLKSNNIELVQAELTYVHENVRGEKSLSKFLAKLFIEFGSLNEEKFNQMTNRTILPTMLTPDRFFQVLQQLDKTTTKFSSDMLTMLCTIVLRYFDPLRRNFPQHYQDLQRGITSNETAQRILSNSEDFPRPWSRETGRRIIEILIRKYTPTGIHRSSISYESSAFSSLLVSNILVPQLEGYEMLMDALENSPKESNVTTQKFKFVDDLYQQNQLLVYKGDLSSEENERLRSIWCRPVILDNFRKRVNAQMLTIDVARNGTALELKSLRSFLDERGINPYRSNIKHNIKQTCESEFILELLKNNSQLREIKDQDYVRILEALLASGTSPELLQKFPFVINDTINSILNLYSKNQDYLLSAINLAVNLQRELSIQASTQLFAQTKANGHMNGYEAFYAANSLQESSIPAWENIPKMARILVKPRREKLLWSLISNGLTYQIVINNSTGILELIPHGEERLDKNLWKFRTVMIPFFNGNIVLPRLFISQEEQTFSVSWGSSDGPLSGNELKVEQYGANDFKPFFLGDGKGFYLQWKGHFVEVLVNDSGKPARLGRGKTQGEKAVFTVARNL